MTNVPLLNKDGLQHHTIVQWLENVQTHEHWLRAHQSPVVVHISDSGAGFGDFCNYPVMYRQV